MLKKKHTCSFTHIVITLPYIHATNLLTALFVVCYCNAIVVSMTINFNFLKFSHNTPNHGRYFTGAS